MIERSPPGGSVHVRQVQPVALALHPGHHVAQARPVVEPTVDHRELGLLLLHAQGGEGGGEEGTAAGEVGGGGHGGESLALAARGRVMALSLFQRRARELPDILA